MVMTPGDRPCGLSPGLVSSPVRSPDLYPSGTHASLGSHRAGCCWEHAGHVGAQQPVWATSQGGQGLALATVVALCWTQRGSGHLGAPSRPLPSLPQPGCASSVIDRGFPAHSDSLLSLPKTMEQPRKTNGTGRQGRHSRGGGLGLQEK